MYEKLVLATAQARKAYVDAWKQSKRIGEVDPSADEFADFHATVIQLTPEAQLSENAWSSVSFRNRNSSDF